MLAQVARHEASHALGGVRLGLTVTHISIVQSATEHGITEFTSGKERGTITMLTMEADRGNLVARRLLGSALRFHILASLAGPAADLYALEGQVGETDVAMARASVSDLSRAMAILQSTEVAWQPLKRFMIGAWPDLEAVYQMATYLTTPKGPSRLAIVGQHLAQAEAWVRRPKVWEAITRLADHLVERRTLDGAKVTATAKALLRSADEPVGSPSL
jgi:hypothetical protein